ncbi:MAG: DUF3995 domain-containing protein [Flavisolibacter sp.]|nr:DUF3995 domain-containing protein [Flavisolibacter sp.]
MVFFIYINTLIFLALAFLHVYWALGGKRASTAALPSKPGAGPVFIPSRVGTLVIAVGLFLFAGITISNSGFFNPPVSSKYIRYATFGIAIIFLLRAIGDFKYVGLTKGIKNTAFARKDNSVFTPLCIVLTLFSFLIAVSSQLR